MVTYINKNCAAFPVSEEGQTQGNKGLTKREYFAAMALQGIMNNLGQCHGEDPDSFGVGKIALGAADSLLKALEQ